MSESQSWFGKLVSIESKAGGFLFPCLSSGNDKVTMERQMVWQVWKCPAQYLAHSKQSINVYEIQGQIKLCTHAVGQSPTSASRETQIENSKATRLWSQVLQIKPVWCTWNSGAVTFSVGGPAFRKGSHLPPHAVSSHWICWVTARKRQQRNW